MKYFIKKVHHDLRIGNLDRAIDICHQAIESGQSFAWYYFILAEAYFKKNSLTNALFYYKKALSINSKSAFFYYSLGIALRESGQYLEASINFKKAIVINYKPSIFYDALIITFVDLGYLNDIENFDSLYKENNQNNTEIIANRYYNLAHALTKQGQWHEAASLYKMIIDIRPILIEPNIYSRLGFCFFKLGTWEEAIEFYKKSISIQTSSVSDYNYLSSSLSKLGKLDEAIDACKQAIHKVPNYPGSYWNLGNLYVQKQLWKDAIKAYYKVIEINPNYMRDRVNIALKKILIKSVADEIWDFLNQSNIKSSNLPQWPLEIDEEQQLDLYDYFTKNSEYKTVDWRLIETLETSFYLKKLGVKTYYELQENIKKGILHQSKNTKTIYEFNLKALEKKSLQFICPTKGTIVESNFSFIVDSLMMYRFNSTTTYYLIVGGYGGHKLGIYFPDIELIISFSKQFSLAVQWCNKLKSFLVSKWNSVQHYLLNENEKKLVGVVGILEHFGHTVLNEYPSYQYLFDCDYFSKFERIIIGDREYVKFRYLFPETENTKIIKCKNNWEIFEFIVNNNCFAIRPTNPSYLLPRNLAERISKAAILDSSESCLQEIEYAKKCFPLLWFEIRTNDRIWLNQAKGIAQIVNRLSSNYPNLGVVFAGWSYTDHKSISEFLIQQDKAVAEKSISLITSRTNNILSFQVIGYSINEKISWAGAADLHIVGHGSGYIFPSIANKSAVIHTNTGWYPAEAIERSINECHRNHPIISVVPIENITDDKPKVHFHVRNYYCNWESIYHEIVKLLNNTLNPTS